MTPRIRAALRRAAAERSMQGSERDRDACIEGLLADLQAVFTPRFIDTLSDDTLAALFEDWVRSLPHLDAGQRVEALIQDVRLCAVPFLVYRKGVDPRRETCHEPEPTGKVVALHTR